jgi:hypothetical protein
MADDEAARTAAWLERIQGVRLDPARVKEPAATAERIGRLTDAAGTALPFGAEPSGFALAQARLRRGAGAKS